MTEEKGTGEMIARATLEDAVIQSGTKGKFSLTMSHHLIERRKAFESCLQYLIMVSWLQQLWQQKKDLVGLNS